MSLPLTQNPLKDLSPSGIEDKLLSSTGNSILDDIKTVTFLSLTSDTGSTASRLGARRAIQLLYNLNLGGYIQNSNAFNDQWLRSLPPSLIDCLPLKDILQNSNAYDDLYKRYRKEYIKQRGVNPRLELADIKNCLPVEALSIAKLLILLAVTTT